MVYAFDFTNPDGSVDHFQLGLFNSDAAALDAGRDALLASLTANAVNVWRDDRLIGSIPIPRKQPSLCRLSPPMF